MEDTILYFNREALGWSEKYRRDGYFRERLEIVVGWLAGLRTVSDGGEALHILDYGCGSGVFMEALLSRGYRVTGVDASPGMIEAAQSLLDSRRETFPPSAAFRLECLEGFNRPERYAEERYPVILCLGVLEYVENPDALMARLASMLAPGGSLILSVPNRHSLLRKIERFVHAYPGIFRYLPAFRHLTGADAYLNFQKHQFDVQKCNGSLEQFGLALEKSRYHVAPRPLRGLSSRSWCGMTMLLQYRKVV